MINDIIFPTNVKAKKETIEVPSEIIYIRKVSSEILSKLKPYGIDEDKLFDIRLCAEEAVRNAIVHGNRSKKELRVRVHYWVEDGRFNMDVEDEGAGFDPGRVPDPTKNDNIMKGSGRGVYLIKRLMDRADFNEKGNKLSMEKILK